MMRFSTHWAESMGFFKEKYGLFQRKVFGQDDGPFNTLKFQSLFLILVFPHFSPSPRTKVYKQLARGATREKEMGRV